MYVIIWEYEVRAGREAEFEAAYGPAGAWVLLFAQAEGYRGTELLRDPSRRGRYATIDRWESAAHYERFREQHARQYQKIDDACAELTAAERLLGRYNAQIPRTC